MEVRLLGSGGFVPTRARETACVYVRSGARVLLLDAGTGVSRLVEEPSLLRGVERLDVLLTHFHLDHVVGLGFLPALSDVRVREVWGAGAIVAATSTRDLVHRLLDPPFFAPSPADVERTFATAIHDVAPPRAEIGGFSVELRVQPRHATPTLAVKVNDVLAYCTDTGYDPENAAFARGSRLLLHEAFYAGGTSEDSGHSASGEAARVAAEAGVERLLLVHVNPEVESEEELVRFARERFPASEIGRDGPVAT